MGPSGTAEDVADLTGATDEATVTIGYDHGAFKGPPYISATVVDPRYEIGRYLKRDTNGRLWIKANRFYVDPKYQRQGLGRRIFGRMVENAIRLKVDRIEAIAERGAESNGYYTWPLFGYDGDLDAPTKAALRLAVDREQLPKSLQGATRVSQLFETQEGAEWWRMNGTTINLTFDLSPNSYSRQTWEAYLRRKTPE
jgi:GNAT superfamily N-acetyltransferase